MDLRRGRAKRRGGSGEAGKRIGKYSYGTRWDDFRRNRLLRGDRDSDVRMRGSGWRERGGRRGILIYDFIKRGVICEGGRRRW